MDSSFHVNGIVVPTWFQCIAALEGRGPWSILRMTFFPRITVSSTVCVPASPPDHLKLNRRERT
jgi:hypothetical protein